MPESLLAELQSVSERVAKVVAEESHKLAIERVALEAEKAKQAERLAEQQFALRRHQHALVAGQLELRRVAETTAAIGGYQQQRIRLVAGTTPFTAAAPTLCERAPNSVLAQLVKGRLAEHEREHAHDGGAEAEGAEAEGAEAEPIEIFIDREASVVHWLLTRTLTITLTPTPTPTLTLTLPLPLPLPLPRCTGYSDGCAKVTRRWPRCHRTRCACCLPRPGTGGWASSRCGAPPCSAHRARRTRARPHPLT